MRKIHTAIFLFLMTLGQISCQTKEVKIVFENNSVENPTELNETQKYILKKKSIKSDFDYSKLDNIDNYAISESFEPVRGEFSYYQFTMEWAEMPFQYDVYKSKTENIILADNLDIKSLNLNRTEYWNDRDKLFKESGIIKLK